MQNNIALQILLDFIPDAVIAIDPAGRIIHVNTHTEKMFGYSREELLGELIEILIPDRNHKRHSVSRTDFHASPSVRPMGSGLDLYGRRKNGDEFHADISLGPVETNDNTVLLSIIRDVSHERRRSDETRSWLSAIVEFSDDVIVGATLEGSIHTWNMGAEKLYGCTAQEANGRPITMLVSPHLSHEILEILNKTLRGELIEPIETVLTKDRQDRYVSLRISVVKDSTGRLIGVSVIGRDITEQKLMEEKLVAEKELLSVTLKSIGDGVITTDIQGKILSINRVAEEITGWPQAESIGKPLQEVFHIIDEHTRKRCENPFQMVIHTGEIVGFTNHTVLITRDQTEKFLTESGSPIRDDTGLIIGVVIVFQDATQKHALEMELLKASKLESIGIIAGGIAHDFNNFLTGILGNIGLAKRLVHTEDELFQRLVAAEKAAEMAKNLPQQLLAFSKGGTPIKKTEILSEIIQASINFSLSGSTVEGQLAFPEDLWPIQADSGQLTQVFNNLIINSVQAMPKGGIIQIRCENFVLKNKEISPLKGGEYIKIEVQDQGIGIAKESISKIFDPFFSTKHTGSGLGITTTYTIIKNHGGLITVDSELDVGTTFTLFLPASPEATPEKEDPSAAASPVGPGKILVMDDEKVIRELVQEILICSGHQVKFAENGEEAITIYRQAKESGHPFDLVIMDLTIRGEMGGEETIQKLLEFDPKVKAIVSSGYTNMPIMAHYRKYGFSGMIKKPYKPSEFLHIVNTIIRKNRKHS